MTKTFRATVSDRILSYADKLFNSSVSDILNELLQNSRRAGATEVRLDTMTINGSLHLVVIDNGKGIEDPSTLLNLSKSDWDSTTQKSEAPAGIGFFSLAPRGAYVWSKDWAVHLRPEHFNGLEDVTVEEDHDFIQGTNIAFPVEEDEIKIDTLGRYVNGKKVLSSHPSVVESCSRYYPLPVYWKGERVCQLDFLADLRSSYMYYWEGLKLGVVQRYNHTALNFYGIQVLLEPIEVSFTKDFYGSYSVAIDVVDCPKLELVLPARKEIVEGDFSKQLREQCYRVIYQRIAEHHPDHRLSYESWKHAQGLGVDIPIPQPKLYEYVAKNARYDFVDDCKPQLVEITDPERLAIFEDEDSLSENLAVNEAFTGSDIKLVQPNDNFKGYPWYDNLVDQRTFEFESVVVEHEGIQYDPEDIDKDLDVDLIKVVLVNKSTNERIEAPLDYYCHVDTDDGLSIWYCPPILIVKDKEVNRSQLENYLRDLLFNPESGDDTYDTQEREFDDEVERVVKKRLLTQEEYVEDLISDALSTIRGNLPSGFEVRASFIIQGSDVSQRIDISKVLRG